MSNWWQGYPWRHIQTNLREIDMIDISADQVVRDLQAFNAVDNNRISAVPGDLRTHGDQAIGKVYDLGLAGGIFEHGLAVRDIPEFAIEPVSIRKLLLPSKRPRPGGFVPLLAF